MSYSTVTFSYIQCGSISKWQIRTTLPVHMKTATRNKHVTSAQREINGSWNKKEEATLTGGAFGSTCGSSLKWAASRMCFTASIRNPSTPFSSQKRIISCNKRPHWLVTWHSLHNNNKTDKCTWCMWDRAVILQSSLGGHVGFWSSGLVVLWGTGAGSIVLELHHKSTMSSQRYSPERKEEIEVN